MVVIYGWAAYVGTKEFLFALLAVDSISSGQQHFPYLLHVFCIKCAEKCLLSVYRFSRIVLYEMVLGWPE